MLKKASVATASVLLCTQIAAAASYDNFFAFGDSTTDSGWFANTSTGIPAYDASIAAAIAATPIGNLPAASAHFTGPGPNWSQLVASSFGLTANPANAPGGTNYAIGGAYDYQGGANPFFGTPPSTTSGNIGFNPNLPSTATQIGNYLASAPGGNLLQNSIATLVAGGFAGSFDELDFATTLTLSKPLVSAGATKEFGKTPQVLRGCGQQHLILYPA